MVFNLMTITCSKFLSQLLVSSFQLLLPVVVSCIVWMFVVRLWFSFWGQWQNCRLIWTFSCGVLLYYCTCANHTPFQIVQWQVGLRKRSVFFRIWRKRCLVVYTFFDLLSLIYCIGYSATVVYRKMQTMCTLYERHTCSMCMHMRNKTAQQCRNCRYNWSSI